MFSISFIAVSKEIPEIQSIEETLAENVTIDDFSLFLNSYIYDSNNKVISEVYSSENRIYLSFPEIPSYFVDAVIATEDRQFFSHKGFDMAGIIRALFVNIGSEQIEQGGSTITQQLVKNLFLSNERTYHRKLTELLYAYQFENTFSKEEIIELYLNTIYFQHGVYGIEAASRFYFSRSSDQLSLEEVAFLIAIPNNPTFYNPLTNFGNTILRRDWILTKMLEIDLISESEHAAALESEIDMQLASKIDLYPDYVTYIHYEFEQLVGEVKGYNKKIATATSADDEAKYLLKRKQKADELLASGVHIYTAFDQERQDTIYRSINRHLPEKDIEAVAVIINHDREIVALTGGRTFQKFDFHRGYQAFRQPGSAIKSLLVFPPYLSEKNAKVTRIINAGPFCKYGYCPQNFGGAVYGNVSIETAFKHSYNTAAVRMLDQITVERAFSYFNQLGFSKIVEEDYRLPAAMGGLTFGVSPLEMTSAYTTFIHDGKFQNARAIRKVTDRDGNLIFKWTDKEVQVWDKETNRKMRNLLNKVVTEGTGRRANFRSSYIGGKTGTTNDFHDLWFIGLTENYTAGVWVGKDIPKSLEKINSRSPQLLIWRDLIQD